MQRGILAGVVAFAVSVVVAVQALAADDHMKCYKIKDPVRLRGTPPSPPSWLDLTGPEFGSEQCKIVGGFRLFCTPVTKTVTAPIDRNTGAGYSSFTPAPLAGAEALTESKICYKIKCADNAVPNPDDLHSVFDQFGNRNVSQFKPFLLCGPAEEGKLYTTTMNGANEVPANGSTATGSCNAVLRGSDLEISCTHDVVAPTGAHLHNGAPGVAGPIVCPFPSPVSPINFTCTGLSVGDLGSLSTGNLYVNIHSNNCGSCPGGEIRGQLTTAP